MGDLSIGLWAQLPSLSAPQNEAQDQEIWNKLKRQLSGARRVPRTSRGFSLANQMGLFVEESVGRFFGWGETQKADKGFGSVFLLEGTLFLVALPGSQRNTTLFCGSP